MKMFEEGIDAVCLLLIVCVLSVEHSLHQVRLVYFVHSYTPWANPGLAHSGSSVDSW